MMSYISYMCIKIYMNTHILCSYIYIYINTHEGYMGHEVLYILYVLLGLRSRGSWESEQDAGSGGGGLYSQGTTEELRFFSLLQSFCALKHSTNLMLQWDNSWRGEGGGEGEHQRGGRGVVMWNLVIKQEAMWIVVTPCRACALFNVPNCCCHAWKLFLKARGGSFDYALWEEVIYSPIYKFSRPQRQNSYYLGVQLVCCPNALKKEEKKDKS